MSDGVTVIGGAGGTVARMEDLERAAAVMSAVASTLEAIGRASRVAEWAISGLEVGPEGPYLHERAIERIAWIDQGSGGATRVAKEVEGIAGGLRQTVDLLEGAERESESILTKLGRFADAGVSLASVAVWVPLKVVGAGAGAATDAVEAVTPGWLPTHWVASGGGWVPDTLNPDWNPDLAPLLYGDNVQDALALGDSIYKGATFLPDLILSTVGLGLPDDLVTLIAGELALVSLALDEILGDPRGLLVVPVASRLLEPPEGLADLFGRLDSLSPTGADGAGRIAIERIDHADGSHAWIVEIPGTQDWVPDGGTNVLDSTSNLLLMSVGASALTVSVERAMIQAGIPPGEEVLLVGHSQGGIAAMSLASRPEFTDRFNVTAVATAGAPVGGMRPLPGIAVMSLEHPSDTAPALDGTHNPDQPNWTTVRRDLAASDDPIDRIADGDIVGRHELGTYVRTAVLVDESGDTSVTQWFKDTESFWGHDGGTSTRTVYEAIRGTDGLTIPGRLPVTASSVPGSG